MLSISTLKLAAKAKKALANAEVLANSPFYGKLPGIGVADLLMFVHRRTVFLKSFTHVLDRYVKHDPDTRERLACVVAMGTNMGIGKVAEVSGLSFASLLEPHATFFAKKHCWDGKEPHVHAHQHMPLRHAHSHYPVIHHRYDPS